MVNNDSRHCERSEAIHLSFRGGNGLLRRFAPRNDGKKKGRDYSRPFVLAWMAGSSPAMTIGGLS
jgi:hypothetical protein